MGYYPKELSSCSVSPARMEFRHTRKSIQKMGRGRKRKVAPSKTKQPAKRIRVIVDATEDEEERPDQLELDRALAEELAKGSRMLHNANVQNLQKLTTTRERLCVASAWKMYQKTIASFTALALIPNAVTASTSISPRKSGRTGTTALKFLTL